MLRLIVFIYVWTNQRSILRGHRVKVSRPISLGNMAGWKTDKNKTHPFFLLLSPSFFFSSSSLLFSLSAALSFCVRVGQTTFLHRLIRIKDIYIYTRIKRSSKKYKVWYITNTVERSRRRDLFSDQNLRIYYTRERVLNYSSWKNYCTSRWI